MQYSVMSQGVIKFNQKILIEMPLILLHFVYNNVYRIDVHIDEAIFHTFNLEKMHFKCLYLNFKIV